MTEKSGENPETTGYAEFPPPDRLPGAFLRSLGTSALCDLFSIEKRMSLPANFALYRQGEVSAQVYVLLDGKARVSFESDAGRRFISRIAKPGEVLGLAAVVTGQPYATTAELIFPAEVCSIQREDFVSFLNRRLEASWAAMCEMGLEIEQIYARLQTVGLSSSVPGRLARLILEWSALSRGDQRGRRQHMSMTHDEIGNCIGVSRESVTRALNFLQRDRVIEVRGAQLTILDLDELELRSLK